MNALDEIRDMAKKKGVLRERAREIGVKIGEIDVKKRLPEVGLHSLNNLWNPFATQILNAAHLLLLQVDDTWLKQGLQKLEKEGQTVDLREDNISDLCNFSSQTDQEELLPVFTAKLKGEMSYSTFVKRFNELRDTFEREIEDVERECSPIRAAGLEMSAEIVRIDQQLKAIADAAASAISG